VLKLNDLCPCAAMLQTDVTTGRLRRIQRSTKIERSLVSLKMKVKLSAPLITLNERNPEYHTVASYVKKDGLLDRSILSIFRIQNMDLWELFCRKKQQLMRIHGVKDIQEKRLFHGTNITNVDTICKYNFDLRLAGQHGSVFGKGIYFAIHASYADKYSQSSTDPLPVDGWNAHNRRTKIMFLARVIVGTSTVGGEDFRKPDHESPENTHDSCVNDINNPSIFVIFDPNQIYPEYLIHYK
uniref:Poly [ADP-ribose] polymerase n=1 Tax=Acanthochromis polyacanthus TaxID=80966 RepID=A0A3Q1F3L6_9TELE